MVRYSLRLYITLFIIALMNLSLLGQGNYNRFWYFGAQAGLDFNTAAPTVLTNGAMSAFEGCATIADTSGNLLFYTNGSNVWNRNHSVMPTGTGLNGDGAATQTAIIVPKPGSSSEYYVFTVDTNGGVRGLNYNIVDMSLNGGLGDVSVKNVQMQTPVTEKLTAVRHANGIDAWVIVHDWNGSSFYSYPVTAAGISSVPVISNVGIIHGGVFNNSHGYLKACSNARKIACAIRGSSIVQVFDFNNITGQISNPATINTPQQCYGVEFSPDNHFLYVSLTNNPALILQYDMTLPAASIAGSQQQVGSYTGFIGALQLAKNNKIYACQFQSTSLAVIDAPNNAGTACAFTPNALFLGGKLGQYGLPNFLQSFFITADFTYADTCSGAPTQFTTIFTGPDSVKWNFGDPASGAANFSTAVNPQHTFATAGNYTVELIVYQALLTDTVRYTIQIFETPDPNLGSDQTTCNSPLILDGGTYPNFPPTTYLWSNGSNNQTINAAADGIYWVEVKRLGCIGRDTVQLTFLAPPVVNLGTNQTVCDGQTVTLDAGNTGATYLWNSGATTQTISITQSGSYSVTVTVGTCTDADTVDIIVNPAPQVGLGNDTTLCTGLVLFLQGGFVPGATYLWSDGSTTQGIFVDKAGVYSVRVSIGNCQDADTIAIDEQSQPDLFLGDDQYLCAGQPLTLDATTYGANYVWQDGSTGPTFQPFVTGNYFVDVINQCGTDADSVFVNFQDCSCAVYVPNAFTPNGDPTNSDFRFRHACEQFSATMRIYNRFGQLLFESDNDEIGWDGNYDNKPAIEGVYIYEIKYKAFNNGKLEKKTLRDTFLLLR